MHVNSVGPASGWATTPEERLELQLARDLKSQDPDRMARALQRLRAMPPGQLSETIDGLPPEIQQLLHQVMLSKSGTAFAQDHVAPPVQGGAPAPVAAPAATAAPQTAGGATTTSGTPTPTGNAAVDKALQHVGVTKYNHSHARPPPQGQLDCSQLVSEVYPGLPPDVRTQGRMGQQLGGPENAQPGDLVFFDENGSGEATHVGIADGKGNIVHASVATGEVCVTPIADIPSQRTWATRPA